MHINVVSGWIQMDFWPVGITCILILFFVGLLNVLSKYIKRRQRSSTPTSSIRRALQEHWNLQTKNPLLLKGQYFYLCEDILHQSALSCTTVVLKITFEIKGNFMWKGVFLNVWNHTNNARAWKRIMTMMTSTGLEFVLKSSHSKTYYECTWRCGSTTLGRNQVSLQHVKVSYEFCVRTIRNE